MNITEVLNTLVKIDELNKQFNDYEEEIDELKYLDEYTDDVHTDYELKKKPVLGMCSTLVTTINSCNISLELVTEVIEYFSFSTSVDETFTYFDGFGDKSVTILDLFDWLMDEEPIDETGLCGLEENEGCGCGNCH